ncbi:ATP-binding protein [Streptomyces fulvorobeus]|uniref:ATP-binding protein n=1 Tax=Streptomyces fulvorobeus TaxID=284028 RepID=A0A7J0CC39_9ACTN|nr:ATP-binding protein [Streptomyces fulvorobeus]NYE43591.1 anti-sigma regulatory factor (Ser/Thr protein kinase) [Streptomyces fulvorobeus]GFN00072.1 ATP-binding protein [Streptomyces fulvorobeus]
MEAPPAVRCPLTVREFAQRFSATSRGARLARRFARFELDRWGIPYGGDVSDTAALLVAELAANAATHGRVPGRDFELVLTLTPRGPALSTLRVEVSDTRTETRPPSPGTLALPPPDAETGRGLILVDALADRWEVLDRERGPGKTVRAELDLLY